MKESLANKRIRERLRAAIIAFFGGKCGRCGIEEPRVLQVDHINRAQEPRNSSYRSGTQLYRMILDGRKNPNEFQLLCANCNWLKKIENKEHYPVHKTG